MNVTQMNDAAGDFRLLFLGAALALGVLMLPESASAMGWVGNDFSGKPCTGKEQNYGPFDYRRKADLRKQFKLVEGAHFKPWIRSLKSNKARVKGSSPYGDLDYVLRSIPNHPHALYAMMRYFWHPKWKEQAKLEITHPECYLQRAQAFAKNDYRVYLLFGIYLHREGRHKDAKLAYEKSLEFNDRYAETHYNYGLLLVALEQYDKAVEHARLAYRLGYALPGLKLKLEKAGYQL